MKNNYESFILKSDTSKTENKMIKGINHYNLRSDEETMNTLKDFYINVVG